VQTNYLATSIAALEPSATEEVDNTVKRMRQNGIDDIVSLGVGEPCFDTPDNIKQAAIRALLAGETKYQPTAGSYTLREAICEKLDRENNILVGTDDILVTAGGKFAIYLAFQAVLEKGDQIIILDPSWVTYEPAAKMAGADVIRVATNPSTGFLPDTKAIRKVMNPAVKLIVVNSPCNPTGAVYSRDVIRAIADLAVKNNALVLSDEVYEYQVYEGTHYSPASEYNNIITVNAFSKSFAMTGWRLGYVTAPPEVLEGMNKIYQHSTSCVTAFAQNGAIEAIRSDVSKTAAIQMRAGYRHRRDTMLELINKSDYLNMNIEPQGAFYCFPRYSLDMPSLALSKSLLEEVHVATVPGAAFGESGEGYLRFSYAATIENITEAFERMETFFKNKKTSEKI
jgi:aspartate aminotransferase